jgi:hypothetical protein
MAAPHQDEDRIAGGGAGIGALADNRSMVALPLPQTSLPSSIRQSIIQKSPDVRVKPGYHASNDREDDRR